MSESVRILHVDDDPAFAEAVADVLEREYDHFEVVTETSARDALARLDDEPVDCLVSDYQLPGMDGVALLAAVREEYPDLPVVLFTGEGSEAVASDAIEAGVTSYLRKEADGTVQYATLGNRIETHVETYRDRRQAQTLERAHELVARTASDVFWTYDLSTERLSFSEGIRHFGYEPDATDDEYTRDWLLERLDPDSRERLRQQVGALLERGESAFDERTPEGGQFSTELRFQRADGTYADCLGRGIVVHDDDEPTRIVGTMTDVTERTQRERELEEERDRRAALFENAPDPIVEIRFEERTPIVDDVNPAFEEVFGIDTAAAVDRTVPEVVVPDGEREEHERLRERVVRGELVDTDVRRQTASGVREFLLRGIPVDVGDVSSAAYAWYTDISERKERERNLQRYERVIQEMNDGVVIVQDGMITETNPRVSEMIGYTAAELRDEPMGTFIAPEDRETVRRRYRERVAGNDLPNTYEISILSRDGEKIPVEITVARVEYEDQPATVSIVRDITERKERQRELERQNERLDEFASIVSHDLRNPLHVASGRLELALEECESEHLDAVDRSHDRMRRLIDDLLTLARVGETPVERTAVDLGALVDRCWRGMATADAELVVEADPTIRADRDRLRQLFENLVRNSIEHGGEDVTVRVGDLDDGFYVEDDGSGVPEGEREAVFESGYSSGEGGTGFGLNIVAEIVDAHGWDVRVTDGEDRGARFEVTGVEHGG